MDMFTVRNIHLFLPNIASKTLTGINQLSKKKTQNCCYVHFDPFRNVIMRLIKKIDLLNFGVHRVLQGILHW